MSTDLGGQTDLFDLLESPPAPSESEWAEVKVEWLYPFTTPGEACPYCGHVFEGTWDASNDHHPMPSEGACVKMSLRRQHVRYWCNILKRDLEPAKCCWGEFPEHKKATFQNVMEHLRKDVGLAREVWADMSWLEPMVEDAGMPVDEVANPFVVNCVWCKHTTRDPDGTAASDAMERHYWDKHYDQEARDHLRAAGQSAQRIGKKP